MSLGDAMVVLGRSQCRDGSADQRQQSAEEKCSRDRHATLLRVRRSKLRSIFVCVADSSFLKARANPQLNAMTNSGGAMMFEAREIVSALVLFFSFCLPLAAQQAGGTKVGVLSCRTSASLGPIVGSHQKLRCSFRPDNSPSENYVGHITGWVSTSV
jgi:hypothetical protein